MTGTAVTMMIVAMVVVWGGLVASILFLRARPEVGEELLEDPDMVRDDTARLSQPHPYRDL